MSVSRTVELRYQVAIPEPRDDGDPLQIWLPLPASTPQQDVIAIETDASMPIQVRYDHVLATMTYDKSGEGWGAGDTERACSTGRGNCTDFHTLFLAILRCRGIACELEIGAAFPTGGYQPMSRKHHFIPRSAPVTVSFMKRSSNSRAFEGST